MKTISYVISKSEVDEIVEKCGPLGFREYINMELPMKIFTNGEYFEVDEVTESENGFYIIKYLTDEE